MNVKSQVEINKIKNILLFSQLNVTKFQRVQNWNLYRRYQIKKAEVTEAVKKYMPKAQVERYLFHGTAKSKLNAICKSGFDRDYSGTSAG